MNRVVNQRYTLLRTLGEGGMGEVFLAADRDRPGTLVALKYLARRSADAPEVDRLREEFRRMRRLSHPHLVQVHDLETDRGRGEPFIVMEYVEGVDFQTACQGAPPGRLLELATQVCLALEYLHSQGLVHCDLKPENILVARSAGSDAPRARLLDFGLAATLGQGEWEGRGSLPYAAPEQFRGEWVDHRADLYSLGVLLYQALTGRLPLEADTPAGIIQAHLSQEPVPPSRHCSDLDPGLEAIVLRLLRKRPAERYQSAAQVREALRMLAAVPETTAEGGAEVRPWRTPRLVGREAELAAIDRLADALVGAEPPPDPARMFLHGAPGSGKTRLAEEARTRARSRGIEVVTASADDGASSPFHLLLRLESALRAAGQGLWDRGGAAAPAAAGADSADAQVPIEARIRERVRGMAGVSPLLIVLEDLHAADPDSLRALGSLVQNEEGLRLGILATSREPLSRLGPELAAAWEGDAPSLQISLEPLSEAEISLLLASLLGADPAQPVPLPLLERSVGNPRFAVEWARALAERGLLEVQQGAWRIDPAVSGAIESPPGLVELGRLRLEGLPLPAAALASALAVLGRPVPLAAAAAVSSLDRPVADEAARELRWRGLLTISAAGELSLTHAALRDAARELATEPLPALHARAAAWLESSGAAPAAELAFHWREAGDRERIVRHALRGAEDAAAAGARTQQARLLKWALEATPAETTARRIDLLRRLAAAYLAGWDWERGREVFARMESEALSAGDRRALLEARVEIHGCCAWLMDDAGARVAEEGVLDLLRVVEEPFLEGRFVRSQAHAAAWNGDTQGAVALARKAASLFRRAGRQAEAALCLMNLGVYLIGLESPDTLESLFNDAETLLREAGEDSRLFLVRLNQALVCMRQGRWEEAARRLEQELEGLQQDARRHWLPQAILDLAFAREQMGLYDRALAGYEESADLSRRLGQTQVRLHAFERLGTLLRRLGLIERALRVHSAAMTAARRAALPAQIAFLSAALSESCAAAGEAGRARELAAEAASGAERLRHARARLRSRIAAGRAALAASEPHEALSALAEARRLTEPAHQHLEVSRLEILVARAALALGDRGEASAALARALDHARRGSLAAEEIEAVALRVEAGLSEDAEQELQRLAAALQALIGRIDDPAVARLARTAPAWKAAAERAAALAPEAASAEAKLPEKQALRALADIGRVIETLEDPRRLARTLLERARELVGAERALLLLLSEADGTQARVAASDLPEEAEQEALEFSRCALAQGLEAPLLILDAPRDPRLSTSLSVEKLGIRSILCAPLRLHGTLLGAIYLDSRAQVLAAGPDHLRFVEAFAHQAAAALDAANALDALRSERERLRGRARERYRFHALLGRTPAMQEVYDLLEPFSKSDLPVLVTGESGTGKELVARALHWNGPRRDGPFVAENCASLPVTLLESELFGHLRGAFTGAERDRRGLFEEASGGTLLLDEIGEMSPALQAKLLRVLQEKEVRPLGAARAVRVDARIVAATQRDLAAAVREGSFREDLLYRLRVLTLRLPPLRDRLEDLPLLARHFLEEHRREHGRGPVDLSATVLERLERYPWPGNVRELRTEVQKMAFVVEGVRVETSDLEAHPDLFAAILRPGRAPVRLRTGTLKDLERQQVERALLSARGDKQKAADMLGLSRATLYRKLRRYRIASGGRS